jgi:uncharacterized OB-fold protein
MTLLEPQSEGIPLPHPSPASQPFWDGCERSELLYQRCSNCGRAIFIPALLCRFCGSRDLSWAQSAGLGAVYSWSIVWRPQSPAFSTPYAAAIIDLDEGYQMLSNVIGCEPDDIHAGLRVAVEFHLVGEGINLPYFRPQVGSP